MVWCSWPDPSLRPSLMSESAPLFDRHPVTRYCHRAVPPGACNSPRPAEPADGRRRKADPPASLMGRPKPDWLNFNQLAPKESVDSWPLAITITTQSGARLYTGIRL